MYDAGLMRVPQCLGDFCGVSNHVSERQRPAVKSSGESFTIQILHYEVIDTVVLANIKECANVRAGEGRDGACFALEPCAVLSARDQCWRDDLDRYGTAKPRVVCPINLAHAACADERM